MAGPITDSVRAKLWEQIELTKELIERLPEKVDWRPEGPQRAMDVGHLLGHLLECLAGFCAVFHAAFPEQMTGMLPLKNMQVNHCCGRGEAQQRIVEYSVRIGEGFENCTDADLERRIPSIFVPRGERLMTLLLGNLEHFINHKYQLFFYLKMMGVPVATRDLYRFRETAAAEWAND